MNEELEIHKMLVVSASHVPLCDLRTLGERGFTCKYGINVWIGDGKCPIECEELLPSTWNLIRFAWEKECSVLCLDCDGEILPGFPRFEENVLISEGT